jgi:hypothetical protein
MPRPSHPPYFDHSSNTARRVQTMQLLIMQFMEFYLFVFYLTSLSVAQTIQPRMIGWIINSKGCGRKRSPPNFGYYPGICREGLRKTMKNLSQDTRSPSRDLKPGPPEYEAGVLTTRPRRY